MRNSTNPHTCIAHLVIEDAKPCHKRAVADDQLSRRRYMLCDHHLTIIARDNKQAPKVRTMIKYEIVETDESDRLKVKVSRLEDEARNLRRQVSALENERDNAWVTPRREVATDGTVYFLRTGGYIKIGWTSDIGKRMKAYPPDTVLLATMPGTRSDELREHKRFAHLRTHGREWYPLAAQITERISVLVAEHGEPRSVSFAAKPVTVPGSNTKQALRVKSWR